MKTEMALKDALLEIISCMLSPNSDLRGLAEERRKALEVTDEYAVHLMEILLTSEEALEERQMAGTLMRQYVRNHWNHLSHDFVPPLTPILIKERIRTVLPAGLSDAISKIRNNIAVILVTIAEIDYPEEWPNMCESVFERLASGDSNTCIGVLEFIRELNRAASCYLVVIYCEKVYPVLFAIAQDTAKYNTKIRADAIYLFANTSTYCQLDDAKRVKLFPIFSEFCEMCRIQLVLPHPAQSDYYLKASVIKAYTMLLAQMKNELTPIIINMLPTLWQILSLCGQMFDEMLTSESAPDRDPLENPDDAPKFYMLVYNIFEMLYVMLNAELAKPEIVLVLSDLVYYTVLFMGLPKDTEDAWRRDSDTYFADDCNDECYNTSVRVRAKELLLVMTRELNVDTLLNALTETVNRHTSLCKLKNESYYWRIMEAVMYAIGTIKVFIVKQYKAKHLLNFDISGYLAHWVNEIGPCPSWLMAARIMWVGGSYAIILEENVLSSYLMATIHNLREPSFILQFSAIRSISLHLTTIAGSKHLALYMEIRHSIAHALIYAIDHSQGYILHIGLFALELLLELPPSCIETVQDEVIALITNVFLRNVNRSEFITDCQPIVKLLTVNLQCRENLETKFLPIITNVINQAVPVQGHVGPAFEAQCSAIELLNIIIKYSPEPLSDNLIRYGFIAVYTCILSVDDPAVTQCGADCLRSYLCKAATQMITFSDNEGRTGADYILNVLKYVLDPNKMDLACKQVGRFFITALHTLGPQLNAHIDFLLRAVLSSMQRANTILVEESLLIIFAYLFYYHLEPVLNYLTLIPGPEGQSALAFILEKWLSKNYSYGGKYSSNLNILALTRLMEHTILQQDQRVADIKVQDINIPKTFSLSAPRKSGDSYPIPVLLKVFKHLIIVLQNECDYFDSLVINLRPSQTSPAPDRPSSSREQEPPPVVFEHFKRETKAAESSTDEAEECCDILHSNTDPLDATDPIFNLKIKDFLTNFFKNFSENSYFSECVQYLNRGEKTILYNVGVNIDIQNLEDEDDDS